MTIPIRKDGLPPPLGAGASTDIDRGASAGVEQAEQAAKQFEGLLLQQLWQTLRKTVSSRAFGAGGAGGGTYFHFVDEAMSQGLVEAGGLGLQDQLTRALGGSGDDGREAETLATELRGLAAYRAAAGGPRQAPLELGPTTGVRVAGATGRLQQAARQMLLGEDAASRWARDGRLGAGDLASDFATPLEGGALAAFNVRDAAGYAGEYKCNLFAFELARRAGFQVPLTGRKHGWGFPEPNGVTADAADGRVRRDWARVVTGESADTLDAATRDGSRAFMLTGAGSGSRSGHMAVVERVHEVRYGPDGEVAQIVFDGWEARRTGARRLHGRTWNRLGTRGGHDARGGFSRIEILELLAPQAGRPEQPLGTRVGPSLRDGAGAEAPQVSAPGPNARPAEPSP